MTEMIRFLNAVYQGMESHVMHALYLDFEEAFGKVCHKKLLEKLYLHGFSGGVLAMIESYLKDRECTLELENHVQTNPEYLAESREILF